LYLLQEWPDGKKLLEDLFLGNYFRHLMAAMFGVFRKTDAFKAVS